MLLQLENVVKSYHFGNGTIHAVEGVSLQLAEGEFLAVRGPSGCGKSTLLLMAGALLNPDAGEVRIAGQAPYSMGPDQRAEFRAKQIGFVFQQFHLVPYLSVLENILAPALAVAAQPAIQERARGLIEQFGLTERARHLPAKLSSGERQRVAMARSLLNQPQLLLADEPTGNLDPENAEILLQSLAEFAARGGGVLLVTHDDRAASYAQQTVTLPRGRIAESAVQAT